MTKLCLECLLYAFDKPEFCDTCGHKMVDWDLKCECGASISPSFRYCFFPPWGRVPMYKHCAHCGRKIDKLMMQEVKRLRTTDDFMTIL